MSKQWHCNKCDPYKGGFCKHLQALMPESGNKSVKYLLYGDIERIAAKYGDLMADDVRNLGQRELEFRQKLIQYGLEEIRIDVLILKFVYNWSYAEIALALNIPNRTTVFNICKKSYALLQERDFK